MDGKSIIEVLDNKLYAEFLNHQKDYLISFFTPTYNRCNILPRLYNCLLMQTNKKFVWIIVNDGSIDNTDDVIKSILFENLIPILYISKSNGHKHSCFKVALERTQTKYFACMDDDDTFSSDSVDFLYKEWGIIESEGIQDIGAIRSLTKASSGGYMSSMPVDTKDLKRVDRSYLDRCYLDNIYQENWTCYETEKLRNIDLFPQKYYLQDKHSFFSEMIWIGRFSRKYRCRYINYACRQYHIDAPSSIMRDRHDKQHYMDLYINLFIITIEQYDYLRKKVNKLIKNVIILHLLRNYLKLSFCDCIRNIPCNSLKAIFCITSPISILGKPVIKFKNM